MDEAFSIFPGPVHRRPGGRAIPHASGKVAALGGQLSAPGLADVRVRLTYLGGLLAACVTFRGLLFPYASPVEQVLWVGGGLSCLLSLRWGATVVALVAWWTVSTDYYNHVYFLAWTSAAIAVFQDPHQLRTVLRAQLSIVYGFAAVAKIGPVWLSGLSLRVNAPLVPEFLVVPMAFAAIVIEGFLAVALWFPRLRPLVLVVAVPSHVGFWLLVANRPLVAWGLLTFNALTLGILFWVTRREAKVATPVQTSA